MSGSGVKTVLWSREVVSDCATYVTGYVDENQLENYLGGFPESKDKRILFWRDQ